jgi:hypothetical protein
MHDMLTVFTALDVKVAMEYLDYREIGGRAISPLDAMTYSHLAIGCHAALLGTKSKQKYRALLFISVGESDVSVLSSPDDDSPTENMSPKMHLRTVGLAVLATGSQAKRVKDPVSNEQNSGSDDTARLHMRELSAKGPDAGGKVIDGHVRNIKLENVTNHPSFRDTPQNVTPYAMRATMEAASKGGRLR